ncbi:MAG: hypothetical protein H6R19_1442 [Proteobacteria bacterium]|nr:hypothetical protein [Pseudomonadota bacterium]
MNEGKHVAEYPVGAATGREAFHASSLRRGRVSIANQVYLLTFVTNQRKRLFLDWPSARVVVNCLRTSSARGEAETLAYCLMPDHLHWLIALQADTNLSKLAGSVKSNSARKLNQTRSDKGLPRLERVWQAGFHDHALRKEEDLQALARYTVANPLRAGLVSYLGDYALWDAKWL